MSFKKAMSRLDKVGQNVFRKCLPDGLLCFLFSRFPIVRNRVLFQTFQGDYCCNPRAVTELLAGNPDVEIVWVLAKGASRKDVPRSVKVVRRGSIRHLYMISTAAVWFENGLNIVRSSFIRKRPGQTYFQPLHGSLGLKRQGLATDKTIREKADRITDYCISNSSFEDMVYRTSYWPTTAILQYGHPRNDIFFLGSDRRAAIIAKVRERLRVAPGVRLALYAPTFRSDGDTSCFDLDVARIKRALAKRFGGEWVVLSRMHKRSLRHSKFKAEDSLDASRYPDMQELLLACDIGITDYSSWICDFVLGTGYGFIYAKDIDRYEQDTGFYYPLSETPFPIAKTNDELEHAILSFDAESYASQKASFLKARGCIEDGHASERCAEKIIEAIKKETK